MSDRPPTDRLRPHARRRAMALGYVNGALWSVGNGLTTGTVIYYLAQELGAKGLGVSLILAGPTVAGLLRLLAPVVIRRLGGVKPACLVTSLASYVLLASLPLLALPGLMTQAGALAFLVVILCTHQLLEYLGSVALWSWLAGIVPLRIRGRYFARRQIWQLLVLIPTLLASGWFLDHWKRTSPSTTAGLDRVLIGYVVVTGLGAVCLLASLWPLWKMPGIRFVAASRRQVRWRELMVPFADRRFLRLLAFGCWFSFFNGFTQSAQNIYPYAVLGLGVFWLAMMRTLMRCGQIGLSPWVGKFSDRFGNRPVLVLCQLLVAAGPLFFFFATRDRWWLLFGAWIVWSAYVGLNVGLPNLMLKLSPSGDNSSYIATYFAITAIFYAVSTICGGILLDRLAELPPLAWRGYTVDRFDAMFLFGWITRTMGLLLLLRVIEPGAWSWSKILRRAREEAPV